MPGTEVLPSEPVDHLDDRRTFAWIALLALANILLHTLFNHQYGFHRDELLTLDNSRHLDWGYVVYPPVTPFLARIELLLFGASLRGFRLFPALSQGIVVLLTALMARHLGGTRYSQLLAAVAISISGYTLFSGSFMSYSALDYLWWVLAAYFLVRLLCSSNPRWCIAVGATIGIGLMTKYTMAFFVLGIVGGVLGTSERRFLKSPWLWLGVATALLITAPNLLWQAQHHFVSLDFLRCIHARDISWGWTDHFLTNQLINNINFVTAPLMFAGLWFLFADSHGKRYRLLGWMYIITLVAFLVARGRDYYLAPAYPMLLAAGAVFVERWHVTRSPSFASSFRRSTWIAFFFAGCSAAAVTVPMAPVNSGWWHFANRINGNFHYEIGWPDMVQTVAQIRDALPPTEAPLGILTRDDGQLGALNLYGPAYHLSPAFSGMNSNWFRGYPDPPPQTIIVVGMKADFVNQNFESCSLAGHISNRYGINNKAIDGYADVFVCRHLRQPWPVFWDHFMYYG